MLTNTKIALSALLVVGFASAAMATESVEFRIGDQYPFLEKTVQPQLQGSDAFAQAPAVRSVKPYTATEQAQFDRASGADLAW